MGSAAIRLTVSVDGAGNSESADFVLRTLADTSGAWLSLAYAEAADPTHPNGNWSLDLSSADGQALRPGVYANAYSSGRHERPAGAPTLDLVSGQILPSSVQGEFVIHELEVDGAGRITRLALNFTALQGSGPVSASGAIRISSARALTP